MLDDETAVRDQDRPSMRTGSVWSSKDGSPPLTSARSMNVYSKPPPAGTEPVNSKQPGAGANGGVTKLMQECTVLLKAKMSYSSTSSSSSQQQMTPRSSDNFSFDAVGPVLESVLGGLTQEYERRLHAKDTEIIATTEKMNAVSRQMEGMQAQLRLLKEELEQQQEQAAANASQASAEQNAEMQERLHALEASLEERERLYRDIEARLGGQNSLQDERAQELEAQLQEMTRQIEQQEDMQEKYRSIQEENRKFYNTIQELKGSIRVFCRVRPLGRTGDSSEGCLTVAGDNELAAFNMRGTHQVFKFDKVFREGTTQEDIYADTQSLVRSVLDGFNVCIFAYGQTGSGKTHTMSGTDITEYAGRGINYRALDDLFSLRDERAPEVEYEIRAQMLEIYNESLRDLLVSKGSANKLDILNTQASGCNVPAATQATVETAEDVLSMMAEGSRNRHSAETKMNERSSRSHQVLTVVVDGHNTFTGARTHGCLHLVDLAGSERNNKSEATGDRLVEANHINGSLSALGDVMAALANKQKHIPFRNSKLTQLLADSLAGQAKVMMFMHVAPELSSYQETTSTLKFATRVNEITLGQAKKNEQSGEVHRANEELIRLKQQLAKEREEKEAALAMLQAYQERDSRQSVSLAPHQSHDPRPRTPSFVSPLPRVPPCASTPLSQPNHGAMSRHTADGTPLSARSHTSAGGAGSLQRSGSATARCYGSSATPPLAPRNLTAAEESPAARQQRPSTSAARPSSGIPRPSTADCSPCPSGSMSARPAACYGGAPTPPHIPSLMLPPPPRPASARPPASGRTSAPTTATRASFSGALSARSSGTFGGGTSAFAAPAGARASFGAPASSRTSGTFGGGSSASARMVMGLTGSSRSCSSTGGTSSGYGAPSSARTGSTYGGSVHHGSAARSSCTNAAELMPPPASAGGRRASGSQWSLRR